jgi:hypothetical protein
MYLRGEKMKISKYSLYTVYTVLLMTGIFSEGYGFKQVEMIQPHAWYLPAYEIDQTGFPMIPLEKDIRDFPEPVAEDELDPDVLGQYYDAVSTAYRNWGEEQKNIVKSYRVKVQKQQEQLFWNQARSSKSFNSLKGDSFAYSQARLGDYYTKSCRDRDFNAQLATKKAEFYQEIAENCKLLKDS